MLRELRGALTALTLLVCGVLALVSFNIGLPGQELLQSLRFHIAAGLVLMILLLLISGAWWRAIFFLVPLIASVGEGAGIILRQQELRSAATTGATPLFRLLSFNLLNNNPNGTAIADYILASGAGVVMLMEAAPLAAERERLLRAYPHTAGCVDDRDCSTVILSKWPLSNIDVRGLSPLWRNRLVTAVADIDGTRINLVLAHMTKPYFDGFATSETYRIGSTIAGLEGPLLFAGDLNAAAWSRNIARLSEWEKLAPGPRYPATWPVALAGLGVPIDNVFARAPLLVERVDAMPDSLGSNHLGLIAEISLGAPAPPAP